MSRVGIYQPVWLDEIVGIIGKYSAAGEVILQNGKAFLRPASIKKLNAVFRHCWVRGGWPQTRRLHLAPASPSTFLRFDGCWNNSLRVQQWYPCVQQTSIVFGIHYDSWSMFMHQIIMPRVVCTHLWSDAEKTSCFQICFHGGSGCRWLRNEVRITNA